MKRRDFMMLVGGAGAWPVASSLAQQPERVRRIAVLNALAEGDPEASARHVAIEKALKDLGWVKGANVQLYYRSAEAKSELIRRHVAEFIGVAPDVIVAEGSIIAAPVARATSTIPIVCLQVIDPVGSGLIESMAQPGGNVTGFTQFEYSLAGKWLELLKEIAPRVTRVAVVRDPTRGPGIGQFAVIQALAPVHGVELVPINANDPLEAQSRRIAAFAAS